MITHLNGTDTITTLPNGYHRAHHAGAWWLGDYTTYEVARRALKIYAHPSWDGGAGVYDGGAGADEATHQMLIGAKSTLFGPPEPVSEDDARRTILPGERCRLVGGWPVVVPGQ